MKTEFILSNIRFVGLDGDGGDGSGGDGTGGDGTGSGGGAGGAGGAAKTYTKEEFDTHMAGLRRKSEAREAEMKKTQRELAAQLEQAKKQKGLSDEERQTLESRIEELRNEFETEQEKAKRAAQQKEQEHTGQVDSLTAERDEWRGRFESEAASNQITRAAASHKALNTEQIAAYLNPMIEFKEVTDDDGQGTGTYTPVVRFPDTNEEGKPITMEYTVDEAVKRMTEMKQHSNLFEGTLKSGIGGQGNADGKKVDVARLARDNPAEYRRLRKEKPELIYGASKGNT